MTDPTSTRQAELLERRKRVSRAAPIEIEKPLIEDTPFSKDKKTEEKTEPSTYRPGALVKPLTSFYETIGGVIGLFGDQTCGQVFIDGADSAAKSLDEWAKTSPKVRKVLMRMVESSAVTKVLIAHLPMGAAVLAHHAPNALAKITALMMGVNPTNAE